MKGFAPFELTAIKMLVQPVLGRAIVQALKAAPGETELHLLNDGYDIVMQHSQLPAETVVIGSPKVLGRLESLKVRFLVRVEAHNLRLICRALGSGTFPADFRMSEVQVSIG
ncbi:MAG: hypothetical protein AB8C46_17100 [Burkholderiaceae bacterium]